MLEKITKLNDPASIAIWRHPNQKGLGFIISGINIKPIAKKFCTDEFYIMTVQNVNRLLLIKTESVLNCGITIQILHRSFARLF